MLNRLRQGLQLRALLAGLNGLLLGLLFNLATNWLSAMGEGLVPWVVAAFAVLLVFNIWLWFNPPGSVGLILEKVEVLRTDAEKKKEARRGLIAFVSLYSPDKNSPAARLSEPERLQAAKMKDYQALDLKHSNLGSVITAVATHASRLSDCWLIATTSTSTTKPGSNVYAPVLAEYLTKELGLKAEALHWGAEYEIPLDDDPSVFTKTLAMIRRIFADAEKKKISAGEVIADFTGGVRSMPLGMILACLDRDRDIEMIGSHYDAQGNRTGDPFPMVFKFEPILKKE